jgi:hypothetical protein
VEQAILAQQLTYDEDSGARDIHNADHRPEILEGPAKIADALPNGRDVDWGFERRRDRA